VEARIEIRST